MDKNNKPQPPNAGATSLLGAVLANDEEQIWPGLLPIRQAGFERGRVVVYSGEERWFTFLASQGDFKAYVPISPNASREDNTIAFLFKDSPEDLLAYAAMQNDPDYLTLYRQSLPQHDYVVWQVSNGTGDDWEDLLNQGGSGYKLFQGDGVNHVHVGYAVFTANEQRWIFFTQTDPNNTYEKFQYIGGSNYKTKGSLQFEPTTIPSAGSLPQHSHVRCVAAT